MKKIVFVIGMSTLCLTWGCSNVAEESAERAIESEITKDGGTTNVEIGDDGFSMEFKGKDGESVLKMGAGAKIPEGFPKDVPVYKGMKVNMAQAQQQQGMFMVQATSSDSLDKLAAFYEQETKNSGWVEESSTKQADKMRAFTYTKGQRHLNVILVSEGKGTSVTLNATQK